MGMDYFLVKRKSDGKELIDVVKESCNTHNIFEGLECIASDKDYNIGYIDGKWADWAEFEDADDTKDFRKKYTSKPVEHKFCYRVWVKSFYEGEDADRVEGIFGIYERVFTEKSDADEYKKKVEYDLEVLGYHPFESAYKFYDCAVMDSTIVFNWNNVRFW